MIINDLASKENKLKLIFTSNKNPINRLKWYWLDKYEIFDDPYCKYIESLKDTDVELYNKIQDIIKTDKEFIVNSAEEWDNRDDLPPLSGIKYSSYQKCQNSVAIGSVYDAINEYYDNYSTVYDNQQCEYTQLKYYNHNFNFEDSEFI